MSLFIKIELYLILIKDAYVLKKKILSVFNNAHLETVFENK